MHMGHIYIYIDTHTHTHTHTRVEAIQKLVALEYVKLIYI